jgi:hypothetical protein
LKNAELRIYNALGQAILTEKITGTQLKVNINDWQSGIYFCKILNGKEVISGKKLSVVK